MPERQCRAGLILYDADYNLVRQEYRCLLNEGHEGHHVEHDTGWSAE